MRDVYHTLYPQEETGDLQVSRRSLAPAFLAAGDWATVLAALPRQTLTRCADRRILRHDLPAGAGGQAV